MGNSFFYSKQFSLLDVGGEGVMVEEVEATSIFFKQLFLECFVESKYKKQTQSSCRVGSYPRSPLQHGYSTVVLLKVLSTRSFSKQ